MSFDDFWHIFPRRVAKLAAKRAWDKALKHFPEVEILDGAKRYAVERGHEDPKFTKHPSTWLNGGCWMDDPGANAQPDRMSYMGIAQGLRDSNDGRDSTPDFFADASAQPRGSRHH
jgi:hypothetical protein